MITYEDLNEEQKKLLDLIGDDRELLESVIIYAMTFRLKLKATGETFVSSLSGVA